MLRCFCGGNVHDHGAFADSAWWRSAAWAISRPGFPRLWSLTPARSTLCPFAKENTDVKILVTGGAGFIGSHLVDRFIQLGHQVIVVDSLATGRREHVNAEARFYELDVRSPEFARLILAERPEVIPSSTPRPDHGARARRKQPVYDAQGNVVGIINLLTAAAEGRAK